MNDERLYSVFYRDGSPLDCYCWPALKLLAMHGFPLSHNKNQKDFATNLPNRGNANELEDINVRN